jgi:hypothetical protein
MHARILALDSITSGLDASTAHHVVRWICDFTRRTGASTIMVLQQPTVEVFRLFTDVLLMAEGREVYHGPVEALEGYLTSLGFVRPSYMDLADFSSELVADPFRAAELSLADRMDTILTKRRREAKRARCMLRQREAGGAAGESAGGGQPTDAATLAAVHAAVTGGSESSGDKSANGPCAAGGSAAHTTEGGPVYYPGAAGASAGAPRVGAAPDDSGGLFGEIAEAHPGVASLSFMRQPSAVGQPGGRDGTTHARATSTGSVTGPAGMSKEECEGSLIARTSSGAVDASSALTAAEIAAVDGLPLPSLLRISQLSEHWRQSESGQALLAGRDMEEWRKCAAFQEELSALGQANPPGPAAHLHPAGGVHAGAAGAASDAGAPVVVVQTPSGRLSPAAPPSLQASGKQGVGGSTTSVVPGQSGAKPLISPAQMPALDGAYINRTDAAAAAVGVADAANVNRELLFLDPEPKTGVLLVRPEDRQRYGLENQPTLLQQAHLCSSRQFRLNFRNKGFIIARWFNALLMGIILGTLALNAPVTNLQLRIGISLYACIFVGGDQ